MARKQRSDRANYVALLVVGIGLIAVGAWPVGVPALIGAGFYYWKTERSADA